MSTTPNIIALPLVAFFWGILCFYFAAREQKQKLRNRVYPPTTTPTRGFRSGFCASFASKMMGTLLTRTLVLALGYAYPAYECFKTVERNKPEIEQLRFWCRYWILVAALTIFERLGDAFISWLPMYSEAKLAFFIYLWYPKTRGSAYVYETFFRPYVAKHENEIDRNLLELRTRAGDAAVFCWQKAATYGQTRFFQMLQIVDSQSQSQSKRPRPYQQSHPSPPTAPDRRPADVQRHPQPTTRRQSPPSKDHPEPCKEPVAAASGQSKQLGHSAETPGSSMTSPA